MLWQLPLSLYFRFCFSFIVASLVEIQIAYHSQKFLVIHNINFKSHFNEFIKNVNYILLVSWMLTFMILCVHTYMWVHAYFTGLTFTVHRFTVESRNYVPCMLALCTTFLYDDHYQPLSTRSLYFLRLFDGQTSTIRSWDSQVLADLARLSLRSSASWRSRWS